jgi:hypothetical protein
MVTRACSERAPCLMGAFQALGRPALVHIRAQVCCGDVKAVIRRLIALLAALSQDADFSVGCYRNNESRCHRSLLRELLLEHGAKMD